MKLLTLVLGLFIMCRDGHNYWLPDAVYIDPNYTEGITHNIYSYDIENSLKDKGIIMTFEAGAIENYRWINKPTKYEKELSYIVVGPPNE
jgi:16S rRNA G966 N2-methylase RsmD